MTKAKSDSAIKTRRKQCDKNAIYKVTIKKTLTIDLCYYCCNEVLREYDAESVEIGVVGGGEAYRCQAAL